MNTIQKENKLVWQHAVNCNKANAKLLKKGAAFAAFAVEAKVLGMLIYKYL